MKSYLPYLLLVVLLWGCSKEDEVILNLPDEVTFTHLPTDLSKMESYGAIGQMRVIPKSHGGFIQSQIFFDNPDIPVYAMSDGIIYNIRYEGLGTYNPLTSPNIIGQNYPDYALEIHLTKTAKMHYGHVSELAPDILEAAGELQFGRGTQNHVNISIKAGQVIAYIGRHGGFDIGLTDTKRQAYFANPSRYTPDYMGSIPFTDFLTPVLREKVWEINPRTVEPRGGKIAYDVEGTLSGNWFLLGATEITEWSKQLVFGYHELYGDRITIVDASPLSDGDGKINNNIDSYIWWVKDNVPDPATIKVNSGKVKFEVAAWWNYVYSEEGPSDGTVMIELMANSHLKYQFFEDKLPEEVEDFSSTVRIYER